MATEIQTIKASQLAELTEVTDSNYVVVTDGATSKKVKVTKLKGNSLTSIQRQQLSAAYTHSQTTHVQSKDIPTKTSQLANDSDFVNGTYVTNAINNAQLGNGGNSGLTSTQQQQLNTAYTHSQTAHVQASDLPTRTSQLTNDSKFVTETYVTNAINNAQLGGGNTDIDLSIYQLIEDNTLTTTAKTIPDAINEIKSELQSQISLILDRIKHLEDNLPDTPDSPDTPDTNVRVTGVTLNNDTLTIDKIGGTYTLGYTITPSNATNKNVTWSTSEPTVASVNNGIVTANANGTTVITIRTTDGGYTDSCTVKVDTSTDISGSYVTDENGNRLMTEDGSYLITD